MEKKVYKKTIFDPNKLVAIVGYVIILFILSSIITIGLGIVMANMKNLDSKIVLETFTKTDLTEYSIEYVKVNAASQGYGNLIGYMLATAFVVFYMRDGVITDIKDLGKRKRFHAIYIPLVAIGFCILTIAIDIIIGNLVEASSNQATIEYILEYGGAFPMILATVVFAPIVEELIYRKAIFQYCERLGLVAAYLLSMVFFTLPHMLSSDTSNMGIWLLQCVPYASSALLLCLIYHKSKFNIYAAIAAHMLNNIIAVIFTFM